MGIFAYPLNGMAGFTNLTLADQTRFILIANAAPLDTSLLSAGVIFPGYTLENPVGSRGGEQQVDGRGGGQMAQNLAVGFIYLNEFGVEERFVKNGTASNCVFNRLPPPRIFTRALRHPIV